MKTRKEERLLAKEEGRACAMIQEFAAKLERNFPELIAQDPARFKHLAPRWLKQELPPRPGRPRKENITRALRLEAEGQTKDQICTLCIPGYPTMPRASRILEQRNLFSAMRERKKSEAKKSRGNSFAKKMGGAFSFSGAPIASMHGNADDTQVGPDCESKT